MYEWNEAVQKMIDWVEALSWAFDPATMGFAWNESTCQDYQRHLPETIGYEVLRPVVKLS